MCKDTKKNCFFRFLFVSLQKSCNMRKLILFPLVAILAITVSCERESPIEPIAPALGVWDELILTQLERIVEHADGQDTSRLIRHLTWAEMSERHAEVLSTETYTVNLNDWRFIIKEFNFLSDGETMQITIRYGGEGLAADDACATVENGVILRKEFIEITYTVEYTENIGRITPASGQYTGPTFGSSALLPECMPITYIIDPNTHTPNIYFEFTYPDSEANRNHRHRPVEMNLRQVGQNLVSLDPDDTPEGTTRSVHILQLRSE